MPCSNYRVIEKYDRKTPFKDALTTFLSSNCPTAKGNEGAKDIFLNRIFGVRCIFLKTSDRKNLYKMVDLEILSVLGYQVFWKWIMCKKQREESTKKLDYQLSNVITGHVD